MTITQKLRYFFTALQIIFLVLRLTEIIHWSWWWVFSPILFPLMVAGVLWVILQIVKSSL